MTNSLSDKITSQLKYCSTFRLIEICSFKKKNLQGKFRKKRKERIEIENKNWNKKKNGLTQF